MTTGRVRNRVAQAAKVERVAQAAKVDRVAQAVQAAQAATINIRFLMIG